MCQIEDVAQLMQSRAVGSAMRRSGEMLASHLSQAPYLPPEILANAASTAPSASLASFNNAPMRARSNAIVEPSGSCSSSRFDSGELVTMSSNSLAIEAIRAIVMIRSFDKSSRARSVSIDKFVHQGRSDRRAGWSVARPRLTHRSAAVREVPTLRGSLALPDSVGSNYFARQVMSAPLSDEPFPESIG